MRTEICASHLITELKTDKSLVIVLGVEGFNNIKIPWVDKQEFLRLLNEDLRAGYLEDTEGDEDPVSYEEYLEDIYLDGDIDGNQIEVGRG